MIEILDQIRGQLWAEAVVRYKAGEAVWLHTPQLVTTADEKHRSKDGLEDLIEDRPDRVEGKTLKEIYDAFDVFSGAFGKREQMRLTEALKQSRYERRQDQISGVRGYRWYPQP